MNECTPRDLDEAARAGCPIALQLWEDTAEMLACLIMNLMYTLVPDAFIIGGGVAKAGDLLMKPLLKNLREQLFPMHMEELKSCPPDLARKRAAGRRRHGDGRIPGAGSSGTF